MLGVSGDPTELCVLGWAMLVLPIPMPVPNPDALPVGVATLLLAGLLGEEPSTPTPIFCERKSLGPDVGGNPGDVDGAGPLPGLTLP